MILPRFCLLLVFALLAAACEPTQRVDPERLDVAQVVAGSGDVGAETLKRIEDVVAHELARLQRIFDGPEIAPFFVHVHKARAEMPSALVAGVHEAAPGFAILGRHQIHLVLDVVASARTTLAGVVKHELVHELLDQYCGVNGRLIPRWFHEGLAQLLAGDTYLGASEEDLVWRVAGGSLRSIDTLAERFPKSTVQLRTAYAYSYSYVAWLARTYGIPALLQIARHTDKRTSFPRALVGWTGMSTLDLEEDWRAYVVHGSGARWRSVLSHWFSLVLIMVLPVLVLALMRRLRSEERAASRMAARSEAERRAAELREAEIGQFEEEPRRLDSLEQDEGPSSR